MKVKYVSLENSFTFDHSSPDKWIKNKKNKESKTDPWGTTGDYLFSKYLKFSENQTVLILWYTQVRISFSEIFAYVLTG